MLDFLIIFAAVAVGALAFLLSAAARRPDVAHIESTRRINAAPDRIFPLINDLRNWERWSPFLKDPNMSKSYGSVAQGVGATYAWSGNKKVGEGHVEIVDASAPSSIAIKLTMLAPFACENDVRFTLVPDGDGTRVTWAMDGKAPFIAKVMSVLFNMDKMVAGEFDRGLEKLAAAAEA